MLYRGIRAWSNNSLIPVVLEQNRSETNWTGLTSQSRTSERIAVAGWQYSLFALEFVLGGIILVFIFLGIKKLILGAVGFWCILTGFSWLSVDSYLNSKIFEAIFVGFILAGVVILLRALRLLSRGRD